MEMPEFSGEYHRPELDRNNPDSLFLFAKEEQRRLRKIVNEEQFPAAVDFLVEKLERFITQNFDELPELTIRARDIRRTNMISKREPGTFIIRSGVLPLDAIDEEVFGSHTVTGALYKFYRGDDDDLRMYVSGVDMPIDMPGGIYTPLLSIGVEDADIRLMTHEAAEQFEEVMAYINDSLAEYDQPIKDLVTVLTTTLNNPNQTITRKLHNSSPIVAEIERRITPASHIIDALLTVIFVKLDLLSPQNISASQYHLPFTEYPKPAYTRKGAAVFSGVTPQLELIGETDNKELGLFFLDGSQRAIKIPVRYITDMRKD